MNNDLEQFSEETLHGLISGEYFPSTHAAQALARIALAAKRAEGLPGNIYPDISGEITALEKILKWILNLEVPTTGATNRAILLGNTIELLRDCQKPIVATPQLNSPEIPEGWKLVPIELTAEMAQAAGEAHEGESYLPYSIYRAMLAAAPEKENG
ncbi:hypothetical protein [Yersinia bercovieri]|uniref:hypothetical protein n=1 Tax=Yersinia bercovieri TaxID=634 RepID=UPI0025AAF346|nr:hypothetical protein [Yersinia bercovieri]MDN0105231.1 hypothetical protein [Yersinia bercovieri]